LQLMTATNVI